MPVGLTLKYMTRFSCTGPSCEDNCCAGWGIGIDQDHYRKMRRALGQTKADRAAFEKSVKRLPGGRTETKYALIVLDSRTGACNFLGEDRLCSLQRRFGEPILPDVCSTYPRRQSVVGDRIETAAVMSCPEAARQALLHADAMELVETQLTKLPRELWVQFTDGAEIYERSLDVVRMTMLRTIAGAPSLAAGLGTVAALAQVLGDGFGKGKEMPAADVERVLAEFEDPARTAQIARALDEIEMPLEVPMRPLLQVLSRRVDLPEGGFASLLSHAVSAFAIGESSVVVDVARAYLERRDGLFGIVDERLQALLTNYALNHVFAHWYTGSPNLGIWVRGLIVRVALVRFLAYAHPDVAALANAGTASDGARTIERVVVEIVYRMSRAIEHHAPFLKLLDEVLPQTMPGLEHALCLLEL